MSEDSKKTEFDLNTMKLAAKLTSYLKDSKGNSLQMVSFREKGTSFYWSITEKSFILVNKSSDWYYAPVREKDEMGRICLYSPYLFSMGVLIMVPEDEIDFIGFN